MDPSKFSRKITFELVSGDKIIFERFNEPTPVITTKQLHEDIASIEFSYAFCGEQDFGIERLANSFEANPIISKLPDDFIIKKTGSIYILSHGIYVSNSEISKMTNKHGFIGYWDDANLVMCASKEYKEIIEKVYSFMKPGNAFLALNTSNPFSRNFMIVSKDYLVN